MLVSRFVGALEVPPVLVLAVIFLIYGVLGAFMDELAILMVMTPVMYPVVINLGYDGVWFGVFSTMVLLTGMLTPPVGLISFVTSGVSGIPIGTVFRGVTPFWITLVVAGMLILLFPGLVTFLPSQM